MACAFEKQKTMTQHSRLQPATPKDITMAAIKQPYNVILAGCHEAGKTTIFNTLKEYFEDSLSYKFKFLPGNKGPRFESCLHQYMDSNREVKVRLDMLTIRCVHTLDTVKIMARSWELVSKLRMAWIVKEFVGLLVPEDTHFSWKDCY